MTENYHRLRRLRAWLRQSIIVLLAALVLLGIVCPAASESQVTLYVSRYFSEEMLLTEAKLREDDSVVDLLRKHATIDTAYGGGFINRINGVPKQLDVRQENWFYYVNGVLANVGARSYEPQAGDHIWWDYHPWNKAVYVSAVIGAFPEPFLHGYREKVVDTVVVATEDTRLAAKRLIDSLKKTGVSKASLEESTDEISWDDDHYYIVIGSWQEIRDMAIVKQLYAAPKKTGFFIRFGKNSSLQVLGLDGKTRKTFTEAAAILALGGSFSAVPVWLVTGSDPEEVLKAVHLLSEQPQRIRHHAGVVLANEKVFHVPAR